MFVAQGPSFTTADLASAAGVSEGTIFRYFTDKPTLVAECRRRAIGLDELLPLIAEATTLPTFELQVLAVTKLLDDRILQMMQVVSDGGTRHDPDDAADIASQLVAALSPVFERAPDVVRGDVVRDGERPAQLANLLIGMLISNTFLCEKTSTAPVPVERLVEIFLHGTTMITGSDADVPGGNPTT